MRTSPSRGKEKEEQMAAAGDWCEISPLGDLLVKGARLVPDRDAIVFPEHRLTYSELLRRATRVARGLIGLGVTAGDKVGLLAANGPEYVEGFFGVCLAGGVVVPLNARHKSAEIGYITANAKIVSVLTTAEADAHVDFSQILDDALPSLSGDPEAAALGLPETPDLGSVVLLNAGAERDGFMTRSELDALADSVEDAAVEAARRRVRLCDVAAILYTSGTTANPKGCMLSHEAMTRGATERATTRLGHGLEGSDEHDVTYGAGPLFHIGTLAPYIGSMAAMGTFLSDVYFEPGRALELMEAEGVTVAIPWFPAIVQGLLNHPDFAPERLRTLRSMVVILPESLMRKLMDLLPQVELIQACGMTETAGIYAICDPDDTLEIRARAQGRASPGVELRIVDPETGDETAAGESGEILVRGYCVMDGYFDDPEKTREALDDEGWLHTGDLYIQLPEGSVVFNGRLKDMLKVGGENVAALEVEAFLAGHEAVKIAEVVGRPDERLDEVPVAFVELAPGANASGDEIIDWCKGKIANYKIPHEVIFVEAHEWPMSATKVDKRRLRARLTAVGAK
jgi:fatty-acyl-CoA synthase/long-chain acyl-CoA synthetase